MARFSEMEVAAFFRSEASEIDDYLSIINIAHDLPAPEALLAAIELLEAASSDAEVALVAACVLEPIVDLRHMEVAPLLEEKMKSSPKLRQAWPGIDASRLPPDVRERLDTAATVR